MELNQPSIEYVSAKAENLSFFQALASKTRLEILELLRDQEYSISELSKALGLSSAITTRHIQILEEAGIVESTAASGVRGLKKECRLRLKEAQIIFNNNYGGKDQRKFVEVELPVCSYAAYDVKAPCGLASSDKLFGFIDDPRYFSAPNRYGLSLIWFTSGFLEYPVPIYDVDLYRLEEIEITLEICSEYPGFKADHPSDITFCLNGLQLGTWTSPGDFGDRKGKFTPDWWNLGTEYGLLKTISISRDGVRIDGNRTSRTPLSEFLKNGKDHFTFRITCEEEAKHPGGINLFGRRFGDYDQNILFHFYYSSPDSSTQADAE